MTQVLVTENNTVVSLTTTENSVIVSNNDTIVTISESVVIGGSLKKYRLIGSDFTGPVGPNRYHTFAFSVSTQAIVSIGRAFADDADWALSTTSLTNDTLTINTFLADDDVVLLWTS